MGYSLSSSAMALNVTAANDHESDVDQTHVPDETSDNDRDPDPMTLVERVEAVEVTTISGNPPGARVLDLVRELFFNTNPVSRMGPVFIPPLGVAIFLSESDLQQSVEVAASSMAIMLQNAGGVTDGEQIELGADPALLARAAEFFGGLQSGVIVDVRSLVLTDTGSISSSPVVITGSDSGAFFEAFLIDARAMPSGSLVQVDYVEFIAIAGPVNVVGGMGSNVAVGDGASQFIVLGDEDDTIDGGAGDDIVGSGGGDDLIFGGDGNDTVFGGSGINILHGGLGFDTAIYEGLSTDYVISPSIGYTELRSLLDPNTVDILINVEQIEFSDQIVAIDLARATAVVALYENVLARQADAAGLYFWMGHVDSGLSLGEIALQFLTSPEYAVAWGVSLNDMSAQDQVETLYQGLLNRVSDEQGKDFWLQALRSGASLELIATEMVSSPEFALHHTDVSSWSFYI